MKTFRFIVKILVAALVALAITMAVDALDVFHYRYAFVSVYFGVAVAVAAMLGAFRDERSASRYDSIRPVLWRNYGQAAIFVGTACLFVGTPQECEDVCDDLWHHGQQAEVRALTSETEFEII